MTKSPEGSSTYLDRARAEESLASSGRFKNELSAPVPSVPTYPPQPASSPWAAASVPDEPPLGVDINALEPVGTAAEVAKSQESAE
jgi:hypothetical protein